MFAARPGGAVHHLPLLLLLLLFLLKCHLLNLFVLSVESGLLLATTHLVPTDFDQLLQPFTLNLYKIRIKLFRKCILKMASDY